jgi:hypothetical protein
MFKAFGLLDNIMLKVTMANGPQNAGPARPFSHFNISRSVPKMA